MRSTETLTDTFGSDEAVHFNERNQAVVDQFETGLEMIKPHMFDLADQLCADVDRKNWNLIVGDDTSGRLVTRFVRQALAHEGHEIPTRYLRLSAANRDTVDHDLLHEYADCMNEGGLDGARILVVSESAGTFTTMRGFRDLLGPKAEAIDFAILGAKEVPEDFREAYFGVVDREVARIVFKTFETTAVAERTAELQGETVRQKAISFLRKNDLVRELIKNVVPVAVRDPIVRTAKLSPKYSTAPLTNLDGKSSPHLPYASRVGTADYRSAANHCYERITKLAKEHSESKVFR